jgi:pseudouridine-5'-phosphate glycosidase
LRTIEIDPEVRRALDDGRPVVALESAVLTCGLPREPLGRRPADLPDDHPWDPDGPINLQTARLLEHCVRERGAVPATIAVREGVACVGLDEDRLAALSTDPSAGKAAVGDLARSISARITAGTTVSATLHLCRLIAPRPIRVFATGGIGGIHRAWTSRPDVSADLVVLGRTPVCTVCSGGKSVLDVPATLEALEALGVPVLGYRTPAFPRFDCPAAPDLRIDAVETAREIAGICQRHWDDLGARSAVLVAQEVPRELALDPREVESIIDAAERDAVRDGISGRERTPFLLRRLALATETRSLDANIALLARNAALAADVAGELG